MKFIKAFFKHIFNRIWRLLRWIIFASVTGVILGLVAAAFNFCLTEAVTLRETNVGIAIFLPIVGLLIVYLYNKFSNAQEQFLHRCLVVQPVVKVQPYRLVAV